MDMYPKYKSPFGYETGDNGIDSYGVDHRDFSLRDEIEYQTARDNRESQMMQMYNQQGITENYPQYTTNFWGDAGNNYGFGSSNITDAINAHPAMNTTPVPITGQTLTPQTNTLSSWNGGNISANSSFGTTSGLQTQTQTPWSTSSTPRYTTSTPWWNNQTLTPWAGGYDLSRYSQSNVNIPRPIDYSLYGDGFSKEFIDRMENDAEFQKILNEYIIPNEGRYSNRASDRGGKTNYGISQKTYYKEDIQNLTRERANAIIYRDFYDWNGLNKLPYPIRGFVVDYGMPTSPLNAIQTVHKVLDLPPNGNIIGPNTMEKLNNFSEDDYVNFLNNYKKEMYKYYHGLVARDPTQKENLNGWLNRANGAHLAK